MRTYDAGRYLSPVCQLMSEHHLGQFTGASRRFLMFQLSGEMENEGEEVKV